MLGNWDQICVNIQLIKVKVSLLRGFLRVQTNHEGQRDKHFEAISFESVCLFQRDEYGMRVGLFTLTFTHTQLV